MQLVLRACIAGLRSRRQLDLENLGPGDDAPEPGAIKRRGEGTVVSAPVLGDLRHRCWREAAWRILHRFSFCEWEGVCPRPGSSARFGYACR